MNFLMKLMQGSIAISKTMNAVGLTVMIGYGIYQFVKHQREETKYGQRITRKD